MGHEGSGAKIWTRVVDVQTHDPGKYWIQVVSIVPEANGVH